MDIMKEPKPAEQGKPKSQARSKIEGMAYAASGVAMSCSYMMLIQMLHNDNAMYGGEVITFLWPAALLCGSFVLARLWALFYQRDMTRAMSVMGCGFAFLESISILTSYFSALRSANTGEVMSSGMQNFWCLLVALSLSVIAICPAMGLEMMKGREAARKKPGAAVLKVVK